LGEVDVPPDARGSQGSRAPRLLDGFRGPQKGLGGHATPVSALAADQLTLHDGKRKPAVFEAARDRLTGDPATQTHDVKLLRQRCLLLPRLSAAAIRATRAGHGQGTR